jgi:hypothetical protein
MTPELSRRVAKALINGELAPRGQTPTLEERRAIRAMEPNVKEWEDLTPEWQARIEAWEAMG